MGQSHVIVACMRNEALFVVEWVAHHLAAGFDRIVVYTNDCDDGTDKLLARMQAGGAPVVQVDNPGPYRDTIQKQALLMAYDLPAVRQADWVMHIDADEYLNVSVGERRIGDLVALHPQAEAVAVLWKHFGSAGMQVWPGGSVVETFTMGEGVVPNPRRGRDVGFKTVFRPKAFGAMGVHHPRRPLSDPPVIVNAAGVAMPVENVMSRHRSGYPVKGVHCTWDNAVIHHHHVKSDDLHRLKHARGDANGANNAKREIGSPEYHAANRNEAEDLSLVAFRPRVRLIEAELRALPGVAEAEAEAWEWFVGFAAREADHRCE